MTRLMAVLMLLLIGGNGARADMPADPLKSPMWADMVKRVLGGGPVVLDDRVKVTVPSIVENQAQVAVTADARALEGVEELVLFADLNPLQHILTLRPRKAAAYVSVRIKVEQATPVRAAARGADGVWHVGSAYVDAAGGGCSAPAMARSEESWADFVGNSQGRIWREADGFARARLRIRHPMDTGLAKDNTPAYFIEKLDVKSSAGDPLATLELFEPVSEDPTLTLMLRIPAADGAVDVEGRDNNGETYRSTIPAPWRQSAIGAAAPRC